MLEGWRTTTLRRAAVLRYGKPLRETDRREGDVPVVGSAGQFASHDVGNASTTGGTIVVGRKGTAGSVTWFDGPAWVTDTAYWAEPVDGTVTLRFLSLMLEASDLPSVCAQTGVPGLNRERAYAISVAIPPLPEQRRIVDLIGALDVAIAIATADIGATRRVYEAVLASCASSSKGMPLSDALQLKSGAQAVMPDGRYRIVGVLRSGEGFIDRGEIRGKDTGYARLSQIGSNELVYRKLTAWEGPISVSTDTEAGGWVSPEFPILTIDESVLRPGLMRHLCRWPGFWRKIGDRLVGSVQRRKRLNPDALLRIELPMPALDVQEAWLASLDSLWEQMSAASRAHAALQTLRSHVLTTLLSGEHEIPESYDELMEDAS